ncbi:MAG: DnaJ domain-containing protein [Thermoleophilia bacterium]|nr:DnaJ domain-containing protein [Thermoleophilia bacterium]MDH3725255.1 DnaJ domain-containing protein [Thermoleophilia bacterium]
MSEDFYELLGVPRDASDEQIKKAFRKRARELHPDVSDDPDAEERFKHLAGAYEALSNPDSRARYDQFGEEGLKGTGQPDFADFGSFQDLFDAFFGAGGDPFGGSQRTATPTAGQDQAAELSIDFLESAQGTTRKIDVELIGPCDECDSTGAAPEAEFATCNVCEGAGQVEQVRRTMLGQVMRRAVCPQCQGQGKIPSERCPACLGRGRRARVEAVEVEIPAGIDHGQRIAMRGRGHAGAPGAPPGDLYIHVAVASDERFVRDGLDIISTVQITVFDAMRGTTVQVPTVDGEQEVELDPGTQPHHEVVLRGKGFPAIGQRGRGNQRVIVEVLIPRADGAEGKDALDALESAIDERAYGGDAGLLGRLKQAFR